MSDNINLSNLNNAQLRTFDFESHKNLLSEQQFVQLIKKEGEITLDSQGNFKVVNPPASRDNFLVSFIKRIFVRGYVEKEKQLDRMEALRQNVQFNAMIREHVKNYAASQIGNAPVVQTAQNISNSIDAHFERNTSFKMEQLNGLIQTAKTANETVKQYTNSVLKDNCGLSSIGLNGESLSLSSFMEKYAKGSGFSETKFIEAIIQNAVNNPEQFEDLSQKDNAKKLKTLLSKPSPKSFDQKQVNNLIGNLTGSIRNKINDYIQKAISGGYSPESIAAKVMSSINGLINDNNGANSSSISGIFGEGGSLAPANITGLEKSTSPVGPLVQENGDKTLKENTEKLVKAFPSVPAENISKIIAFNNNDPQKIDNYINTIKKVNTNNSGADSVNALVFSGDRFDISELIKKGEDILNYVSNALGEGEITEDKLSETIKILVNYSMLAKNNDRLLNNAFDGIENITLPAIEQAIEEHSEEMRLDLQHKFQNGEASPDSDAIERHQNILQTIRAVLVEAKEQIIPGRVGSSVSKLTEQQIDHDKKEFADNIKMVLMLNRPTTPPEIKQALNSFPEGVRSGISKLFKGIVREHVAKHGLNDSKGNRLTLQTIANQYAQLLSKDSYLMKTLNMQMPTEQFLQAQVQQFLNHPEIGIKSDYLYRKGKKHIVDNWNVTLDRDIKRNFVARVNNVDITQIENEEEKVNAVKEELNKIDPSFRGFLSTFLMQGSSGKYVVNTLQSNDLKHPNEGIVGIFPDFNILDGQQHGLNTNTKSENFVDIKDNKIVVTTITDHSFYINPQYNELDLDVSKESTKFYTYKIETTIDMTKGVDKDGYPLGIEAKISVEKVNHDQAQ
ncbi:hypothetical protein SAMN02910357_01396 [Succinivibrio dextrinosolvens]|uniref:hypothetical protein n=1 Tax=Succinivibrio dextrinosolvens TaxID=83771 RepID=UPI0008DF0DA6|nr:hypothetical protein [Succinivibrio dextrinosolvens]SFS70388.1 hypothetical protein SAMN02910357_01396 [Succinivibrio dextrinosolvens]